MTARSTRADQETRRAAGERGAAVADFALTSVLLTVLVMIVLQVGVVLYVRNTLTWCASEGARAGGREDGTPEQGVMRTRELIEASLTGRFAGGVTARYAQAPGQVRVVEVRVEAPLPLVGTWTPGGTWGGMSGANLAGHSGGGALTVRGRAFAEVQGW